MILQKIAASKEQRMTGEGYLDRKACFIPKKTKASLYVKYLKKEVFYCGFPRDSLEKIKALAEQKGLQVETSEEGMVISKIGTKNEDYAAWKNKIPIEKKHDLGKRSETFIIGKLKNYPIDDRTPHETVQFVYEVKELIELLSDKQ